MQRQENVTDRAASPRPTVHSAPGEVRLRFVAGVAGSHRFASEEESNAFVCRFAKLLVEAVLRGEGSLAVWTDGRLVHG